MPTLYQQFFSSKDTENLPTLRSLSEHSLEIFKQSLAYYGPIIWNSLPSSLKSLDSTHKFQVVERTSTFQIIILLCICKCMLLFFLLSILYCVCVCVCVCVCLSVFIWIIIILRCATFCLCQYSSMHACFFLLK